MKLSVLTAGLAVLLLTLVLACSNKEEPATAPKLGPPVQEMQKTSRYHAPNLPIRTEYPDTMKVEMTGSSEGSGFIFSFKPQGNALDQAKVHIFLPRGVATAAAQEPFVTGPNGLLANNGWHQEGETTDTAGFPYGWVKKIISFTDPGHRGMVGEILLGQDSGEAIEVILYYPAAMDKKFLTSANLILAKLHFNPDKLPIGKAQ